MSAPPAMLNIWGGSCFQIILSTRRMIPCDSWLLVFLKSKVSLYKPLSFPATKNDIQQHMPSITQEILLNSANGVMTRLTAILLNNGQSNNSSEISFSL
ncbi:hypothetical protein AVEN_107318-1 [Araneus ventricosus]|uniref:Uncharacterized protein n=1 Tax=Araneus ventricosus TaxID=182803 RepID=A0A4Y2JV50_ARAVE|nr:hypothetical protein AVEN_107318-1 [Araneus ventricosus]